MNNFKGLKERVENRLQGWSKHLLSKARKITLIKSVIQATLTYSMSTFRFPTRLCNDLDALIRKFWWGAGNSNKFMALKAWKDICKPKDKGSLGIKRFTDINSSLLAKLGWKVATGEETLWTRMLKAKYLKNHSFFECTKKVGDSPIWKGILSSRAFLKKGVCFKIGNGSKIKIWTNPWIPSLQGKVPVLKEGIPRGNWKLVADMGEPDGSGWQTELIKDIFSEESANAILSLHWPMDFEEDWLCWCGTDNGRFTVKSCYVINCEGEEEGSRIWKILWKAQIHDRLKVFLWRVLADVLPTKGRISAFLEVADRSCTICGEMVEDSIHLFKNCSGARALAFASSWGGKFDTWNCLDIVSFIEMGLNPPLISGCRPVTLLVSLIFLHAYCTQYGILEMVIFLKKKQSDGSGGIHQGGYS